MVQVIRNFTTVAELTVIGEIHGQETVNVWHFGRETPWNIDTIIEDLRQLAVALAQCIEQTLLPALTQDWIFSRIKARTILGGESDEVEVASNGVQFGEKDEASHSFACTLLNLKTGGGGRSGRGRKFLPPCGEADTSTSTISGPELILLAAFVTCLTQKFLGNPAQTGWNLVVWSRKNQAAREVKSMTINPNVAVMHSRRKGVGS